MSSVHTAAQDKWGGDAGLAARTAGRARQLSVRRLRTSLGMLLVTTTLLCVAQLMTVAQNPFTVRWAGQPPSQGSEWMAPRNCTPRTNIGFLKSHKCASTAIQNILFRYGHKHNLYFALPEKGSYFGDGRRRFKAEMVSSSPLNKLEPNIFAIHTKWDHDEVRKVMPEDTVYLTIVREPSALFQSLFGYAELEKRSGLNLEQYVKQIPPDPKMIHGQWSYNQMAWDLGMSEKQINNLTAVREMVARAEDQFGLVLVAERMEESLVLLATYLCWELSDVLVLRLNALKSELKEPLSLETRQLLEQKLAPDYLVYRHFAEKFERQVEAFGRARMAAAVAKLRELKALLMDTCGFVRVEANKIQGPLRPLSGQVEGFQVERGGNGDADLDARGCLSYTLAGRPYINLLRERQKKMIKERYPPRNIPNPQRGAGNQL